MKTLYLDIVGGIAGDMTVAALLELGVPLSLLQSGLAQLGLEGLTVSTEISSRHHISGTRFIVQWPGMAAPGPSRNHGTQGTQGQHHHVQDHSGQTHHHHAQGQSGREHHHEHRAYREIRDMISGSALPAGARELALRIFEKLAQAEGTVHGLPPEEVTFHEVGAWDSIADVVCTALAVHHIDPQAVYCSPVPVGAGTVKTAHGTMPVPAPATLLLLEGFPIVQGGPAYERTTPTGAAILAALAQPAPEPFAYVPRQVGVGLGSYDGPEVPNLLRAVLGESSGGAGRQVIECAQANLDDANPEWIGYLMERLLEAGALDVVLVPVQMKKNRPGTQIQVLYPPALRDAVLELIFSEVTTLGVRYHTLERVVLPREQARVVTAWGAVSGKVTRVGDKLRFAPEFESCRALAKRAGVPLQDIYRAAQQAHGNQGEDDAST